MAAFHCHVGAPCECHGAFTLHGAVRLEGVSPPALPLSGARLCHEADHGGSIARRDLDPSGEGREREMVRCFVVAGGERAPALGEGAPCVSVG